MAPRSASERRTRRDRRDAGRRRRRVGSTASFRGVALGAGPLGARDPRADRVSRRPRRRGPSSGTKGFGFVTGDDWDPNAATSSARSPFIYGTLVIVGDRARARGAGEHRHRAVHHRARTAPAAQRPVIYVVDLLARSRRSCTACGRSPCSHQPVATDVPAHRRHGRQAARCSAASSADRSSGASFMTAGLVLAVMITPIVTAISREVLRDRRAGRQERRARDGRDPLGDAARRACSRAARSGLVGAVMLGLGRALGETIAVALVIGSSPQITSHIFPSGDTMAAVIAHEFGEADASRSPRRADRPRRRAVRVHDRRERRSPGGRCTAPTGGASADDDHDVDRRPPPPSMPTWIWSERLTAAAPAPPTALATAWMVGSVLVALVPLVLHRRLRGEQGLDGHQLEFLTEGPPDHQPVSPAAGIWPAIVGTLVITRRRGDGGAARRARRDLPQRVRRQRPTRRVIRFMADVMTGVPSIVMGLFVAMIWVSSDCTAATRRSPARSRSACLMLPIVIRSTRGDAEARARRPAAGERRARRAPVAHACHASCSRPRCPAS